MTCSPGAAVSRPVHRAFLTELWLPNGARHSHRIWWLRAAVLESFRKRAMPIYEYWCDNCHRTMSSYQQGFHAPAPPCPGCGKGGLKRVLSAFSVGKTHRDVYESILSDRQLTRGMMRNDPRALAEWNRRMSGGEKSPPEYEEITERMDKGEWPATQIEQKKRGKSGRRSGETQSC